MITTAAEFRVALQAVLVSILAASGYWECALLMLLILLPWKPLLAAGGYLTQPLADWWLDKARSPNNQATVVVEKELDVILRPLTRLPKYSRLAAFVKPPIPAEVSTFHIVRPRSALKPLIAVVPAPQNVSNGTQDLSFNSAIPLTIRNDARKLAQGVFSNMDLEVEKVRFDGETAEAFVRFKSSNVTGLVIRQRYVLRKSGDHWEVESRQPAACAAKPSRPFEPIDRLPIVIT